MKNILLIALVTSGILCSVVSQAQTTLYGMSNRGTVITYAYNDLQVYPNPVLDNTYIILTALPVSTVFVDVIDMNGNVARTYQYVAGTYKLDVDMSRLPTGLYSVRVHGKDVGFHNLTVVKQ